MPYFFQIWDYHSHIGYNHNYTGVDSELHCRGGGAEVTNEAGGFTEARSVERGKGGRKEHPLPQVGFWGSHRENFGNLHHYVAF